MGDATETIINGIKVKFPFTPYQVQHDYMEKVINSLTRSENAILESPTGTGKTLCLLCSTLAWIENEKQKPQEGGDPSTSNNIPKVIYGENPSSSIKIPKVIYASRTHSQLSQAMKEMKRSAYSHMKGVIIASRQQLCMNTKLQTDSNTDKLYKCRDLRKKDQCGYFTEVGTSLKEPVLRDANILDIEDLDRIGHSLECCSYYVAKNKAEKADIVFMPYNYLLNPYIRMAIRSYLADSIVILDEAHNVDKVCEESASTKITSTQIGIAVRDMDYVVRNHCEKEDFNFERVRDLKIAIKALATNVNQHNLLQDGCELPGGFIFSLLDKSGINNGNHEDIIDTLDKSIEFLVGAKTLDPNCHQTGIGLKAIMTFLRVAFSSSSEHLRDRVNQCYKVFMEKEPQSDKKENERNPHAKIVNFWCFSAQFEMQHLIQHDIRCLILTSGTMSPLQPMINDMGIPFEQQLTNDHIIGRSQVCVKIVGNGVDDEPLNSKYDNRSNVEYLRSLGNTIIEFCKLVPDGLLIFFPSYSVMNDSKETWNRLGIWSKIALKKPIFVEPQTKEEFNDAMTGYYSAIDNPSGNGAIFMAVLRGKVSEGLDFADKYGRAVVITGFPFAPYKEPKVRLKRKYMDESRNRNAALLSGFQWYVLDAVRAINQAVGRVIRHKNDYGAILLCDDRFHQPNYQHNISSWLRNYLDTSNNSFGALSNQLKLFFQNVESTLPKPEKNYVPMEYESDEDEFDSELPNIIEANLHVTADRKRKILRPAHIDQLIAIDNEVAGPSKTQKQNNCCSSVSEFLE